MIDYAELIERKDLRKVVNQKKGNKQGKMKRKEKQVKAFHSMRVTSRMHTRTAAALECWYCWSVAYRAWGYAGLRICRVAPCG